jgi:hypothetical protein
MKKLFVSAILLLVVLVPGASMARTDVFLNFGIGIPAPVFVAPAPIVVAPPPPVFIAPAPVAVYSPTVVVEPAPVIIGPPGWYVGSNKGWYKHHKHHKEHD